MALHDRATDLIADEANPRRILHILQAEVLLAYYFMRQGTMMEARTHTGNAASLARGAGLQTVHAAGSPPRAPLVVLQGGYISHLPAGRNTPETGEMINGFWAVYVLVQHLGMLDSDVENTYGLSNLRIDCPWPLDASSYRDVSFSLLMYIASTALKDELEQGILLPPGWKTIQLFLDSQDRLDAQRTSPLAMMTQATVLVREVTGRSPWPLFIHTDCLTHVQILALTC